MTEVELRVDDRSLDLDAVRDARPEDVAIEPKCPVGAVNGQKRCDAGESVRSPVSRVLTSGPGYVTCTHVNDCRNDKGASA